MTPPPTSDDRPRRLSRLFSPFRIKAIEAYYLVEDFIPRLANAPAWPRLLRLPNLLTVPGDILAGFLLAPAARPADWAQLPLAFLAGLLLYAAGLILNLPDGQFFNPQIITRQGLDTVARNYPAAVSAGIHALAQQGMPANWKLPPRPAVTL